MKKKPYFFGFVYLVCQVLFGINSFAQTPKEFPNKPVKIIVPFPPGGATDAVARLIAQNMSIYWKQPVIVDNRPGAGTIIGTEVVAKAPADGYTMGMVISAHTINPSLRNNLPYDTLKDFSPVTQIGEQHLVLAANPKLKANNVEELINLAKNNPNSLSYGSPGSGTAMHLSMELLNTTAGIKIQHIPYKGGAPAQQDAIGGQIPLIVDVLHSSAPLIKEGRLKALAIMSPNRINAAKGIPTISETIPSVASVGTIGLIAPAGTPDNIIKKSSLDISKIINSKEVSTKLFDMGVDPVGGTPEAYDQVIRAEINKWAPIVKLSGAKVD